MASDPASWKTRPAENEAAIDATATDFEAAFAIGVVHQSLRSPGGGSGEEPARTGEAWDEHLAAGVIATCPVVELEFLCSARSLADRLEKQRLFQRLFAWVPIPDDAYERASQIQQRLTETGHHRSAGPVDLLISVTAERHRLTVLTDDRDVLTVAAVTGQPVRLVTGTS